MILLQSASILICLPIAWIEIESILVSGPVVSLSGFVSAFFSRRCGNRAGWWFGLSGFGITVSCFLLINIYQWGPADARVPVIRVLNVYTLVTFVPAVVAYRFSPNRVPHEFIREMADEQNRHAEA